jgi:hypothetical protein
LIILLIFHYFHHNHASMLQGPCLQVLADALQARDNESTRQVLSDLIDLAAADTSLLRPYLDQTLSAALNTSADESVEADVRHQCLELFLTLCESKPTLARKIPMLVDRAVPVLLRMIASTQIDTKEWSENVGDLEEEDEEEPTVRYGEEALERLLSSIGGNRVVPTTLSLLPSLLQSPSWGQRSAAFRAIIVLVSGADKAVRSQLTTLVQCSVVGLRDAHCCVQHAAAGAIAALCTCFGPDVQQAHHSEIVPPLIQMLDASVLPRLRSRSAKVQHFFCGVASFRSLIFLFFFSFSGSVL